MSWVCRRLICSSCCRAIFRPFRVVAAVIAVASVVVTTSEDVSVAFDSGFAGTPFEPTSRI